MTLLEFQMAVEGIRREKQQIIRKEKATLKPLSKDYASIPALYGKFCNFYPPPFGLEEKMSIRRCFLYIIARIYSPAALAGYQLDGRVRKELSKAFGISPSAVSHLFRNLCFQFKSVRRFRETTEKAYKMIEKELNL